MKKVNGILSTLILIFIFGMIAFGIFSSYADDNKLYLNDLNFVATINEDGSMNVTENWDIKIKDTNTLFKTFKTDRNKYTGISNVSVKDITDGNDKNFIPKNEIMYHVTPGYYYGLKNDKGDFEIAWGVGMDNTSGNKKYQISYTVNDAIAKYSDYAELYWQFIGSDFEINAKNISGTINLPENALSKDDIKVWGHIETLNGEIYITDTNKIDFNVKDFKKGVYLEVRTLFPKDMVATTARLYQTSILDNAVKEETKWANEANTKREEFQNTQNIFIAVFVVIEILLIFKLIKYFKLLKVNKKYQPTTKLQYFRDLPEDVSPGQAVAIINEDKSIIKETQLGPIFSAILLQLSLKKFIEFRVNKDDKNKEEVSIVLLTKNIEDIKDKEEKQVFKIVMKACKDKDEITVRQFQKYIKQNPSKLLILGTEMNEQIEETLEEKKYIDLEKFKEKNKYGAGIYVMLIFFVLFFTIAQTEVIIGYPLVGIAASICIITMIINAIFAQKVRNNINAYTQIGIDKKEEWKAFKKYMEDFSLLDEKEVPAIIIWEQYLVYATAFGIAEKVIKQLKIIYPDIEQNASFGTGMYIGVMLHNDFSSSISSSISSTYASTYSSGGGAGGGFSGGGGGGRWPEAAVAEDSHKIK